MPPDCQFRALSETNNLSAFSGTFFCIFSMPFSIVLRRREPVNKDRFPEKRAIAGKETAVVVRKGRLDLVVLRFMAKNIAVTLRALEQHAEITLPLSYAFDELRGRQYRMLIFAPHALLASEHLRFVGFVSHRSRTAGQAVIDEIFRADEAMVAGLAHVPDLLSYSSLELHPGDWYNLVVFRDTAVKMHVKSIATPPLNSHQRTMSGFACTTAQCPMVWLTWSSN
jgi:hypothetical protein